jgi:sugar/nucleoside kinase (ribokinase family)
MTQSSPTLGVVAVGNALVDVLAQAPDSFITKHGMEKGVMTLIEKDRAVMLYDQMSHMEGCVRTSGGSAANTMAGYASFGGKGGFIGKVADDALGKTFAKDLCGLGVKYESQPLVMGPPTGRCMIVVTPDAHRTMNTFLGASVELSPADIDETLISSAQIVYLEGYLFDRPQAKEAFISASKIAHDAGRKVALTLSDPFCVDRHRHDFINLVQNHVDILFANEEEIKSLFQQSDFENAKKAVENACEIAVLTRSEKGAVVVSKGETVLIKAELTTEVIDTTGAGDQFAAGFLYGLTEGMSLARCGQLGAMAAAEIISHIGPRPRKSFADFIKKAA